MLQALVQRNYEALNRRDLTAIMEWWADVDEEPAATTESAVRESAVPASVA